MGRKGKIPERLTGISDIEKKGKTAERLVGFLEITYSFTIWHTIKGDCFYFYCMSQKEVIKETASFQPQ